MYQCQVNVQLTLRRSDHCNDYCLLSLQNNTKAESPDHEPQQQPQTPALWMCYAGGVGLGGYAGYEGYIRRLRVFDVDMNEARITTWKRVEYGTTERVDEQIIVDAGKPVVPPPKPQEAQPPSPPPAQPAVQDIHE